MAAVVAGAADARSARSTAAAAPFTVPVYDRDNPNRLVALLSGSLAEFQLTGRQPLATVRVEYYDEKGRTNLVFDGTNCIYDARARTAESPNPLRVRSGDGRLELEGVGFTWWQTNNDLVISNRVVTRVRRPAGKAEPAGGGGDQELRITSDRLRISYASNVIIYLGTVRIADSRIEMGCGRLTIRGTAAGSIDRMVAEDEVRIVDRLSGGESTAQTAIYEAEGERETIELTGSPRFREGPREGTAERFVLDRRANILRGMGDARLAFPVGRQGAPGLLSTPSLGGGLAGKGGERMMELSAAAITIQLPSTNGPIRGLVAETNVVLLDREQGGRATAQRASYREDAGLELSGSPVWSSGGQTLRGGLMRYDLARQTFAVTGGATVRVPVVALAGPVRGMSDGVAGTNWVSRSNQVVEIRSGELQFREPWLRFLGGVQADLLEDQNRLGELHCATLAIQYSNRVQQAEAQGGVRLEQHPVPQKDGGSMVRTVTCAGLRAAFDAEGRLDRFTASGGIDAQQTEVRAGGRAPVVRRVQCEELEARFSGSSNIVEVATAERNVVISQGDRSVQADRAIYTGTNSLLSLRGHPVVVLPEGRITEADSISWNRATGLYRIAGRFKSQWKSLPGVTNLPSLPRIP